MRDTTPDNLKVSSRPGDFYAELEPGDVLLFQGADFLAGLAQLTERRTCYHSALYLGTAERNGRTEHLLAHNVSMLWWRDLARQVPGHPGSLHPPDTADVVKDPVARAAFFDVLAANLAENHLYDAFGLGLEGLVALAHQLIDKGGVGVVSIEGYLDRRKAEKLYGRDRSRSAVHHVRSVLALRHGSLCLAADAAVAEETAAEVGCATLQRAAAATARQASGFNAAELLSVVPDCFDRPGYIEWIGLQLLGEQDRNRRLIARLFGRRPAAGKPLPTTRAMVRERLRTIDPTFLFPNVTTGPGWICASYVIATYEAAGLGLHVGHVDGVELDAPHGQKVPLSTPRDLWDCDDLTPVAMFVRGPERWREEPPPLPIEEPDTPVSPPRPSEPAVFLEHTVDPDEAVARITEALDIPVVAGPATSEEARLRALEKLAWRWSVPPEAAATRARWRAFVQGAPSATRTRISEQLRVLRRRAFVEDPASSPEDEAPPVEENPAP